MNFSSFVKYLIIFCRVLKENLFNSIKYWNNVKIILEEREVEESNWNNKNIGETKWTGKL